jgi:hypothetical protein
MLTSIFIRGQIDALNDQNEDSDIEDMNANDAQDPNTPAGSNASFGNVSIGAAQPSCTFRELEQSCQKDAAFSRFRLRFRDFLDILLRRQDSPIQIQHNHSLSIDAEQLVSDFKLVVASSLKYTNVVLFRSLSTDSSNLTMSHLLTGRRIPTIYDAAQAFFHESDMTVLSFTAQIVTFLPACYTFSHFPLRMLSFQSHWFCHFLKSQTSDVKTKTLISIGCEKDHEENQYSFPYGLFLVVPTLFQKIPGMMIS